MKVRHLSFWFSTLLILSACTTQFDVYDPPQEIYAAYCILDPADSVQYLRIARVYQVQGDALQYGKENDLSVKNLTVKLTGGGKTWTATEVDSFPKEAGLFFPYHTIYKFQTNGTTGHDSLSAGKEYTLSITSSSDTLHITGKTTIPSGLVVADKYKPSTLNRCLTRADLEKKYQIHWNKGSNAYGFELRVKFDYQENGVDKTVNWGPTQVLTESERCIGSGSEICYQFEKYELIGYWQNFLVPGPGKIYHYIESPDCVNPPYPTNDGLPRVLTFEVTAIDQGLGTYMLVNNPKYSDPYGSKPEYTNLGGNVAMVGVLGSKISDRKYALLNDCSEYLTGLDNTLSIPLGCTPP